MAEATQDCWLGFDLGGTKMLAQVYGPGFQLLGKERKKTKSTGDQKTGMDRIIETMTGALVNANVDLKRLAGIGIGCPGPVDMDRGILLQPPNLGWDRVDVKDKLTAAFNCPIAVLNDVDAGVYGEYRFGAAQSARCALGVFPGTGIGGGCVYEGEIFRGRKSSCLEIGHTQVMPNGPLCGCGQRGCLEAVASRLAISAQAAKSAARGEAPFLLKQVGTDLVNIRSRDLADSIQNGDKVIQEIVTEAARQIGMSLAGVINLLCPDVVVLGGGLVEALPELIVETVSRSARKRVMPAFRESFKVVSATLGDDATALGAAAWAKHLLGSDA